MQDEKSKFIAVLRRHTHQPTPPSPHPPCTTPTANPAWSACPIATASEVGLQPAPFQPKPAHQASDFGRGLGLERPQPHFLVEPVCVDERVSVLAVAVRPQVNEVHLEGEK
jgi:hypothetical protein